MTVLVIILIVCNILMLTALVAAVCCVCSEDSKKKIKLKNENSNLYNAHGLICKSLCEFLSKKTIKYNSRVFSVEKVITAQDGTVTVLLADKLGFTKTVNINDITITEKEIV